MTIRYDYQIFCEQSYGGISRYFYELINRFKQEPSINIQLDIIAADNIFLTQLNGKNCWNKLQFKGKKDLNRMLSNMYDSYTAKTQHFDVFHPTYYNRSSLNRDYDNPMVITIHDLIDERFHKNEKAFEKIISLKAKHIQQAQKIIAVSENTRKDLIELHGVHPDKVVTIYHGNSFFNNHKRFSLPKLIKHKYILYTGKRYTHKNFDRLLFSLSSIIQGDTDLWLVCAGGGAFNESELNKFKKLKIEHRVLYQPINSDKQLESLYNHALLMVYPSLYEGFGLPIIEAFACGCPVITSKGSSTGEIAGDAALLIDPFNTHEITENITHLLYDQSLQSSLISLGYKRAQLFNWDDTANQTLKLYQSI